MSTVNFAPLPLAMESATLRAASACPLIPSSCWRQRLREYADTSYTSYITGPRHSPIIVPPGFACLAQVGKDSITWLEFMLFTPAPGSCTGDVECVPQGETARRCEPVALRLPLFPDRIASETQP